MDGGMRRRHVCSRGATARRCRTRTTGCTSSTWIHATAAPCVLIAYDADYPEPLASLRPIPDAAGISLALRPEATPRSMARLDIRLGDGPATRLGSPSLEALRTAIPALRGLPLLEALASARGGELDLEYLAPLSLHVTVSPC